MKQVHALIMGGDGHAARRRLGALVATQPDKASLAADVIANILWTSYEQFHVKAVHDFCDDLEFDLPAEVADRIVQTLTPKIERTREWIKVLRGVTRERLVRECRGLVVRNDPKAAASRGIALLQRSADESQLDEDCLYLARGLAELTRDHERALTVIGALMKAGGQAGMAAPLLASHFTTLSRELTTTQFQTGDQAWTRNLTEAVLALREFLPGPIEVGEPEQVQLDRFYEELHAIFRASLADGNRDDFIDGLMIVMDYVPADPATIKNVAGVEDRMFIQLGPKAKLVAVRTLGRLGELESLRRMVLEIARDAEREDRLKLITAIMGGLRHDDFFPFLQKMLGRVNGKPEEKIVVEALGRIGNPEAVDLLIERLGVAIKARRGQSVGKGMDLLADDRAQAVLTALGRIGRVKGIDPVRRNALVQKVIKLTDGEDRMFVFRVAAELFSNRVEELKMAYRDWAAERMIEAMWSHQSTTGGEGASSVNGWREPMVMGLRRLGSDSLPAILRSASHHATSYSGAMGALANVLAEIGNEQAVPLLETMIRCAMHHQDDPRKSKIYDEKKMDVSSGELRDLDRDDLVHTLFYTLHKVDPDQSVKVILDYADQIQAGRLASPGQQTTNFLVDHKLKHGHLDKVAEYRPDTGVDEKEFKGAISEARGGLLTKKATRIAAMVTLGQSRRPEAVPVLLDGLGDKDPMVSSAAHTALAQFLHPVPPEKQFCEFLDAFFDRPGLLKGRLLERFLEFIRREMPKNPPYDRLLERQVEIAIEDGAVAHQIRGAAARNLEPAEKTGAEQVQDLSSGSETTFIGDRLSERSPEVLSELDKRRAYLQARREWIANGKVGTPPEEPA